jgi:BirA family transcriptional regulator, biotin operon repressor / biotin---[acetyl-CoA-carboxylase] ligase
VLPRLRGRFGRPYLYVERCSSTQRLLPGDAPEGAVAAAEEQTEGRGRLGRRWLSPPRASVLLSLVVRPRLPAARWPELSLVAGRACADALTSVTGLAPAIKEPNDVLIAGRKVAGILAEASEGRVVLGVGINVNVPAEQLPEPSATSLSVELGRPIDRVEVLVALLERLEGAYEEWAAETATR